MNTPPPSPPALVQSESDVHRLSNEEELAPSAGLIYSSPELPVTSSAALIDSLPEVVDVPVLEEPRGRGREVPKGRLQSELEINAEHYRKQQQYKEKFSGRHRRLTDIDFEGILNLIGGCNYWQVFVYLIISAHQVPHAMFNLSVVYMMYQPDHWCRIEGLNEESIRAAGHNWTWDEVLNASSVYPKMSNPQRRNTLWHSQCYFYARNYTALLERDFLHEAFDENSEKQRCTEWDYDENVMKSSVVTQWNRVCDDNWGRAHVHLAYSLGFLVGCLAGGFVSDRYGRRAAVLFFGVLSLFFSALLWGAREFEIFLLLRFLLAASNEAADLAAYVLCMEVTGVKYRSIVGSLLQAPWACGYAFLALIAYLSKSWKAIHVTTVVLHGLSLLLLFHLPESPRWLILMDRVDKAEKIIRKACRYNRSSLPSDLGLVRHAEKRKWIKENERPTLLHLFRSSQLRWRNLQLFSIWVATALVYYGLVIALSDQSSPGRAVFDGNFFLNNAIAGAIELPTLVLCVFLLKYGRKRSLMLTLAAAGVFLFIAMFVTIRQNTTIALICMLLAKTSIQGAFNILYIFTSELNPTIVRNSAVGISSMIARMGSGASGYIAILSDVTLPIVPMIIFAVFSLVACLVVFLLPETQDLPLPDTIWDAVSMLRTDRSCVCSHEEEVLQPYSPTRTTEEDLQEEEEIADIDEEDAAETHGFGDAELSSKAPEGDPPGTSNT